jgi:acyl-coenzyme A synthetase/AMP-(fatty) acid ligase
MLRSSKTPDTVIFVAELPHTPTGKLLRRQLVTLVGEKEVAVNDGH